MNAEITVAPAPATWPSPNLVTAISNWANWFLIGSLVVGVISTWLVVWTGGIKEREADRVIAELHAEAAGLATETAKAQERTVQLQLELARLTVARSRQLDYAHVEKLKKFAGQRFMVLTYFVEVLEVSSYAMALSELLEYSGWKREKTTIPIPDEFRTGTLIRYSPKASSRTVDACMQLALTVPNGQGLMQTFPAGQFPDDMIVIIIGINESTQFGAVLPPNAK